MIGIGLISILLRSQNIKKQRFVNEGATDNGKEGDKALDFTYILWRTRCRSCAAGSSIAAGAGTSCISLSTYRMESFSLGDTR